MTFEQLMQAWCRLLRATRTDISVLLMRGPYEYKHYQIEKRTGGKRDIYHPTPRLKAIQRWLVAEHFSSLPVHDAVYSYRNGRSIGHHAARHVHSNFLLRLDFKDFFPSITHDWMRDFLLANSAAGTLQLDNSSVAAIMRVICRASKEDQSLALSIGAPSSPALSNAILFQADSAASEACAALDCLYSRYADDIYVSSRNRDVVSRAERLVREAFAAHAPRLRFNDNKTLNVSKKARRIVTGVVLTPNRRLSVGRELKRSIRTQIHLYLNHRLAPQDVPRLCGLISFVRDIEPTFYESLVRKFGNAQIERLYRNDHSAASQEKPTGAWVSGDVGA